jgi:hypothetical protein
MIAALIKHYLSTGSLRLCAYDNSELAFFQTEPLILIGITKADTNPIMLASAKVVGFLYTTSRVCGGVLI